ncbi:MAG: transcriptional repressor LexA [Cyanobacteria bacterium P01_G01_bin.54]
MESLTKAQQELYDWLVDYIRNAQHAPSIRQMMKAMGLKSPAPIQSRLERLRNKGYITWTEGKARTIRIIYPPDQPGIPVLGAIQAGKLDGPFLDIQNQPPEDREHLDLRSVFESPNFFALRVNGDSMEGDMIMAGDFVVLREPKAAETPHEGEIVAALVKEQETTLKHFHVDGEKVKLIASNPNYPPIVADAADVQVQGIMVGVWRNC